MDLALNVGGAEVSLPAVALLGAAVGYVAGMFGVGGGFLLTPLLVVAFGVPLRVAVGTGLCQIVGTAVASSLRHRRNRQGEVRFDLLLLVGSVVGADAGARLLAALSRAGAVTLAGRAVPVASLVVEALYGALMLTVAALFWRQGGRGVEALEYVRVGPLARVRLGPAVDLPAVPLRGVSAVLIAEVGLALGVLSGLLGIGGGVALMPVLVYGFGFPMRQAAGTGIVALLATSSAGTAVHALRGNVDLRLAVVLLVGSTVSAQLGAQATRRLPARKLRRGFALVLVATAGAIAWDLARRFA